MKKEPDISKVWVFIQCPTVKVWLTHQHLTHPVQHVGLDLVMVDEDRGLQKACFQSLKGVLLNWQPGPFFAFLHQIRKRYGNCRIIRYKTLVKATQTEKTPHVCNASWGRPVSNCQKLPWLTPDAMLVKDKPTVFDFWLCPGAFIGSGKETLLP